MFMIIVVLLLLLCETHKRVQKRNAVHNNTSVTDYTRIIFHPSRWSVRA